MVDVVDDLFQRRGVARSTAIAQLRGEVTDYAESLGAPGGVLDNVRLAVSEALTNIVMHAYAGRDPGDMIVEAWCDEDEHLVVRVCDEGHGLIPRTDSSGLGIGIGLMASMADTFRIANRDGTPGTIVSMRFSLCPESVCVN